MVETAAAGDYFGLCGSVLAERFRVDSVVAEGGFGVVYRGAQLALERVVAIKVLKTPPHLSAAEAQQFRERFASEGKIIARLKHPNIVDVYDFGVAPLPGRFGATSVPWMALEWLDGQTLEAELEARSAAGLGGRSPDEVLVLMRPVLNTLAAAHRQGIVHRDIKPGNIMLTSDGTGATVPKVLDFGISKIGGAAEGGSSTRTSGMPAFSPAYAAPEQVTFDRTGVWTDIHALGLVLSELLTGRSPYGPSEGLLVFQQVMHSRRPTPAAFGVNVGGWEEVLQKAVALAPSARWSSVDELLAALTAALGTKAAVRPAAVAPTLVGPVQMGGTLRMPSEQPGDPRAVAPVRRAGGHPAAQRMVPKETAAGPRSVRWVAIVGGLVVGAAVVGWVALSRKPTPAPPPEVPALDVSPPRPIPTPPKPTPIPPPPLPTPTPTPQANTTDAPHDAPADPPQAAPPRDVPAPHGPGSKKRRALPPRSDSSPVAGQKHAPLHPLPIEID